MPIKTKDKLTSPPRLRCEDDLYTWVQEQVTLLCTGLLTEVDAVKVAEELSDVGNELAFRLESAIAILTMHLLKWDHQPETCSRSWELTVREQRRRITKLLKKNPGLKLVLAEALEDGYDRRSRTRFGRIELA